MKIKPSNEQIIEAANNVSSISQLLDKLGLPKNSGSIHNEIKTRLKELGLYERFSNGRSWCKGLTKETSASIRKQSETFRRRLDSGEIVPWHKGKTKETDSRLAAISEHNKKAVNKKIAEGTWHVSFAKRKVHEYNGEKFHGTWELKYAQWLDSQGIRWRRPKESFYYELEGIARRYTPDFYLIDEGCYVEIKGYETEKDRAKWNQFPLKLKVLKGKELKEMGLIDSYKDISK